jgi:hypothetical protein
MRSKVSIPIYPWTFLVLGQFPVAGKNAPDGFKGNMFDFLATILAHVLTWMFGIGLAGCLLVIPITAYRLFSVLFEKDLPHETDPSLQTQ